MLKTMTILQKQEEEAAIKIKEIEEKLQKELSDLKKTHEYQIGQVSLDYEIKLRYLKEASNLTLQQKLVEMENSWEKKLQEQEMQSEEILKECQAISEYNIIQCELEKKELQKSLNMLTSSYENLEKKYGNLIRKRDEFNKSYVSLKNDLSCKITNLTEEIQEKEEEIKRLTSDIKAYQITINNSQITIEVLKKRLIHSDKDVEQLKDELIRCEEKLIEYESKYYQLNMELKEAKDSNEELEMQYESSIRLNESSVNQLKEELLNKVNKYEKEVKAYSSKAKEDQHLKEQIMQQINSNIDSMKQINIGIHNMEEFYSQQVLELGKKIHGYNAKEKSLKDKIEELIEGNDRMQVKMNEKEDIIKELEKMLNKLTDKNEELNGRCQCNKFKSEEFKAKSKECSQARETFIDVKGKYDGLVQDFEMLPFENKEWKLKTVVMQNKLEQISRFREMEDMKKEKEVLENENVTYKNKLDEQKMRKYKFAPKDKENIGSPSRSVIESPNRNLAVRGSPFRERN